MSVLYSLVHNSEKVSRYVNRPIPDRGETFGGVEYGDEQNNAVLEQISYAEDVRHSRRFTVVVTCVIVELLVALALFAVFTHWMVSNLPPAMGGVIWLVTVISYATISFQCFRQSDMYNSESDLVMDLARNDFDPESTPTWERTDFGRRRRRDGDDGDDEGDTATEGNSSAHRRNNTGANGVDKEVSPFEYDDGIALYLWRTIGKIFNPHGRSDPDPKSDNS